MTKPLKTTDLEIREVGNEVLVHDAAHAKVHLLNGTAGYVLELCDGTRSPSDIARSLSDATGAELSGVCHDVDAILSRFIALRLLVT